MTDKAITVVFGQKQNQELLKHTDHMLEKGRNTTKSVTCKR